MVEILKAAFLGLVQGLTEFLPVSSSGHLSLMRSLLGWEMEASSTFDVAVHLATLAAVLAVFSPEVVRTVKGLRILMMREYWKDPGAIPEYPYQSGRLTLLLICATVPTVIIGLLFHVFLGDFLDAADPLVVALLLVITGSILFATRRLPEGTRELPDLRLPDALLIGIVQGLAILPGISRSGTTIATGLLRGMDRKLAGRFSFLLAVPAILGAGVLKVTDLFNGQPIQVGLILVGMTTAFLSGYAALRVLLKLIERGRLGGFAYYCWAVGLLAFVIALLK